MLVLAQQVQYGARLVHGKRRLRLKLKIEDEIEATRKMPPPRSSS